MTSGTPAATVQNDAVDLAGNVVAVGEELLEARKLRHRKPVPLVQAGRRDVDDEGRR